MSRTGINLAVAKSEGQDEYTKLGLRYLVIGLNN